MSSALLDRRLTPARADLAAEHLRGLVDAPRYAKGREMRITAASAPLRRAPQADAPLETEALFGESVAVYDECDGWAWAQLLRDQYVGYLPTASLGASAEPTHRVRALRTHAYPGPAIKLPPRTALSLGARLTIVDVKGDFAASEDGLYLWSRHLAELCAREPDAVAVAERFLETPYLWGGRTSEGIDCSGLVQTALTAAGVACPRDSDMQESTLGQPVAIDEGATCPRRSHILEGACRNHARSRDPASRQRLAHEDGERAAGPGAQAHRGEWRRRRGHKRSQIVCAGLGRSLSLLLPAEAKPAEAGVEA